MRELTEEMKQLYKAACAEIKHIDIMYRSNIKPLESEGPGYTDAEKTLKFQFCGLDELYTKEDITSPENQAHFDSLLKSAAYFGYPTVVRAMLMFGANPYAKDKHGKTPLDYATEHGHGVVVGILEYHDKKNVFQLCLYKARKPTSTKRILPTVPVQLILMYLKMYINKFALELRHKPTLFKELRLLREKEFSLLKTESNIFYKNYEYDEALDTNMQTALLMFYQNGASAYQGYSTQKVIAMKYAHEANMPATIQAIEDISEQETLKEHKNFFNNG